MTILLQPYTDTHFHAVTEIWLESWRSTGISSPVTLDELRERWPNELSKGWVVTVATQGLDIVGFMAIHGGQIEQLFIAPEHQSQGIGKRLLDHAKKQIPEGFHLTTALCSRAGQFYEREGLTPGLETTHPRFGHRVIEYWWR
jgi:putative acetyltransferase